ncbi:MAG: putative 3 beta-hydroxysteroid dehydrogenase/Delta 5--_4-isomerase [Prokaryotic dsDNA virus sp.]|nr:MAG: putative 3 beta-hydroxysteroid dehydrogenase/Delta 5-->4-isomerase [Prokaryotic dsDNA virus sp.]|tara:strand:+ start:13704 stop:14555 length:852 start_codon:yes stop_codon:yes gene_type:complete
MKVLVTGGAGFVGSNLIKHLKENTDYQITSIDNYFTGDEKNHIEGIKYFIGNAGDRIQNIEKQDIVFHFAEYSRVVPSFKDIDYLTKTNLYGTARVIEQCKQWDAKLIYSASSSKFGGNENLSPYSWVKAKMVEMIKNYGVWYGLIYEICYFYNVYGKNQIMKGDYATVIGIFERLYKENKPLTIYGDGMQTRQFTHINDLVNGISKVIDMDYNEEWYLSSEQEHTINEIADMFMHPKKYIKAKKGERITAVIPKNNTKELLDWKIEYKIRDWIENIIHNEQN